MDVNPGVRQRLDVLDQAAQARQVDSAEDVWGKEQAFLAAVIITDYHQLHPGADLLQQQRIEGYQVLLQNPLGERFDIAGISSHIQEEFCRPAEAAGDLINSPSAVRHQSEPLFI